MMITVWGDSVAETERRADRVEATYRPNGFPVHRPIGEQEDLFWACLPAAPRTKVCDDYQQYLLPSDFAAGVPLVSTDLGDDTGFVFGDLVDVGVTLPVLLDLERTLRGERAASMAFTGELGSGKSAAMKTIAFQVLVRGGIGITIDRTPQGEWARFAHAIHQWAQQAGHQITVNAVTIAGEADRSFDPLRMLPRVDHDETGRQFDLGRQIAEGMLSIFLGYEATSDEEVLVSEALDRVSDHPDRSCGAVIDELTAVADHADHRAGDADLAARLARKLRTTATRVPVLFDPTLPVVTLGDADFTTLHAPNLPLPGKDRVTNTRIRLRFEEIAAQALLYVATAACRYVAFRDDRVAVVPLDEVWWLALNPESDQLRTQIVRDGRKHRAAVLQGSHDDADLGDEVTRGLTKYRLAFRQPDPALAARSAAFVGLDADDPDVHAVIGHQELPTGRCVLLDERGNRGVVDVLLPPLAEIRDGMRTDNTATAPKPAEHTPDADQSPNGSVS